MPAVCMLEKSDRKKFKKLGFPPPPLGFNRPPAPPLPIRWVPRRNYAKWGGPPPPPSQRKRQDQEGV